MIKSMTGFGKAQADSGRLSVSAEIRSINSKFLDLNIRLPKAFSDKELELRNLLSAKLVRGKISIALEHEKLSDDKPKVSVNQELFTSYYNQFKKLAEATQASEQELFKLALQAPEVMTPVRENHDDHEWESVKKVIMEAIERCDEFRVQEGLALKQKLEEYIGNISQLLDQVPNHEEERLQTVKQRLKQNLSELASQEQVDANRFEQELIYYIEKYDISEEKVRLANHLKYFLEVLNAKESNGKKLGFISQEIGREINTLGSKANHSELQKIVVRMKDELEKIKEQSLNVL